MPIAARQPFTSILDALTGRTTCAVGPITVLREELAAAAVLRLDKWQVYVPSIGSLDRERIAQEVRTKFNGRNTRTLAWEYGVGVRWVQKLLEAAVGA